MASKQTFGMRRLARAVTFSLVAGGLTVPLAGMAADVPAAVTQDLYEKGGVEHWLPKAEDGEIFAQYVLGHMYCTGKKVEQDYEKGLRWYRAAAEAGFAPSELAVGTLYFEGQGTDRDVAEAARWFERAAEKGYARAQSNLAALYLGGDGIEADYDKALHWYGEAASQGHMVARYNLAMMYAHGLGMDEPDYIAAYGLLSPMVENGHRAATELMESFAGEMDKEELAAARDLSKKLREQDSMQVALDERSARR
ncbi:sel1 repeat family protein [Guyparkeria hydrothermalis]|uniref:tetratricopeptide repeat protein n=1 Tax=Guyparkeria hydrothermalis TaxID=923 RepID=UPI0020209266|nr:tetratricopeptide repeat protein [Guyparkeria hydrothermalis]MCL7745099.1 sel1 repeat family protein [Guyparkeria hydrothermalis]